MQLLGLLFRAGDKMEQDLFVKGKVIDVFTLLFSEPVADEGKVSLGRAAST